jgi:uncharacterized membrane protein
LGNITFLTKEKPFRERPRKGTEAAVKIFIPKTPEKIFKNVIMVKKNQVTA